ncbi:MAG: NADH:flavin oxidoreductase [Fimbriimonadaceae bacterium]|nr:NADH:flavin oxidoreductase [Alphaproteobacteria bacterium]
MWKPPEKIKHATNPGKWPDPDRVAASKLFSSIAVGSLTLSSRTWVPAMVPWRATEDGFVTQDVIAWYERFAKGQPGAIVVEATGIRDVPSGPLMRIGHDRFIPGLKELVSRVHDASQGQTSVLIQIIDFLSVRRRPTPEKYFGQHLQITDSHRTALNLKDASDDQVRAELLTKSEEELSGILTEREMESYRMGYRERVTDTDLPHIKELPATLPSLFASAAGRAKAAGFDGVELHYAHAYTMASFLSALNNRDDGYGGPRENRVRLPLEVFSAVRREVGDDYPAGCRFLSEDCIEGGNTVEDAAYFATEFAKAGMDFLSLSRGGKFEDAKQPGKGQAVYPYTGPSGYECMPSYISDEKGPFGRNVEPAAYIRSRVREAGFSTPIVVAGGMHGFEQAESVLQREQGDIIGFARQALADPDWFRKVRQGYGAQVRVCEYTNYCEGLDQKHKQVTCQLWDRTKLDDADVRLASDKKRRLEAPDWSPPDV